MNANTAYYRDPNNRGSGNKRGGTVGKLSETS